MLKVSVPPIKCQGIKTKLVPWIISNITLSRKTRYVEPFLGSGVVAFNLKPEKALLADSNPHIIRFYRAVQTGDISSRKVRPWIEREGAKLQRKGDEYYYEVRERFNKEGDPRDLLFLSRACFNGLMRFNRSGGFNVPFGHKPRRFSKAYITKIVNQVMSVETTLRTRSWEIRCADFREVLKSTGPNDFVYCDPPYVGRHVDYYDSWNEGDEKDLHDLLERSGARFILSTWHSNVHRENAFLKTLWGSYHVATREHFYHVGAKEENRKAVTEALVMNFKPPARELPEKRSVGLAFGAAPR
jgi:DNA adenine methylase